MLSRLIKSHLPEKTPLKYVSSLMKVMNVWRDHAAVAYYIWQDVSPDTKNQCETMPPKMIPTRWGTKDTCEEKLLEVDECSHDVFIDVMRLTLDKRTRP